MIEDNDFICYNYTCLLLSLPCLQTHTQNKGYQYDIYKKNLCQYFRDGLWKYRPGRFNHIAANASYLDVFFKLILG